MIQVNNLSKGFAGQELFTGISFNVGTAERIGIVGRNGCGKSTLFKIILGQLEADSGEVAIPKNYRLGYLEQHINFTGPTVLDEACSGLPEEEKFNQYKVEKILFGLGFVQDDMSRDPKLFSGGQQIRINLAKTLVADPHLLLLDEPTNYLDLPAIRWLVQFLKSFPGEILLITHDRGFMDQVTTHTLGMYRGKVKKVRGSTEKLYAQIAEEDEIHQKTMVNQQKKRKEMEDFVTRFKAKANKASQAQSRVKMLEKMDVLESIGAEQSLHLSFLYKDFTAKQIGSMKNIGFNYPGKDQLFSNFSIDIAKDDRIAIIGKNGKGKSTLLNILAGELSASEGEVKLHASNAIGHFGQTNIDRLHGENNIIQEIGAVNNSLGNSSVRSICGAILFSGTMAEKKIKVLSGGERARVMLGKILAKPVNLLLLDEPTNHLDMQSIEILSMQLESFSGAVVFVTHSELLLRQVATKLIVFRKNGVEIFDGNYDEFLEKIGWDEEEKSQEKESSSSSFVLSYKEKKAMRAGLVKERNKILKPLKSKLEKCEKKIHDSEERLEVLQAKLIELASEQVGKEISDVGQEIGSLEKMVESEFELYEELGNKIEEIETEYALKLKDLE